MAFPALKLIILLLFTMASTLSGTHVGWCLCADTILANQECPCPCGVTGPDPADHAHACGETSCEPAGASECRTNCVITLFQGELMPFASTGGHDPLPAPVTIPLGIPDEFVFSAAVRPGSDPVERRRTTGWSPPPNVPLFLRHRSLRI